MEGTGNKEVKEAKEEQQRRKGEKEKMLLRAKRY